MESNHKTYFNTKKDYYIDGPLPIEGEQHTNLNTSKFYKMNSQNDHKLGLND